VGDAWCVDVALLPNLQVRSKVDGEVHVLKKIAFDGSGQADAEASLREAQVLSSLRHPHIGRCHQPQGYARDVEGLHSTWASAHRLSHQGFAP
jgi:hypothetical protein